MFKSLREPAFKKFEIILSQIPSHCLLDNSAILLHKSCILFSKVTLIAVYLDIFQVNNLLLRPIFLYLKVFVQ